MDECALREGPTSARVGVKVRERRLRVAHGRRWASSAADALDMHISVQTPQLK